MQELKFSDRELNVDELTAVVGGGCCCCKTAADGSTSCQEVGSEEECRRQGGKCSAKGRCGK